MFVTKINLKLKGMFVRGNRKGIEHSVFVGKAPIVRVSLCSASSSLIITSGLKA